MTTKIVRVKPGKEPEHRKVRSTRTASGSKPTTQPQPGPQTPWSQAGPPPRDRQQRARSGQPARGPEQQWEETRCHPWRGRCSARREAPTHPDPRQSAINAKRHETPGPLGQREAPPGSQPRWHGEDPTESPPETLGPCPACLRPGVFTGRRPASSPALKSPGCTKAAQPVSGGGWLPLSRGLGS